MHGGGFGTRQGSHVLILQKDVDLLLLHDDTQLETDKEKPLSICVSESDCTLSPDGKRFWFGWSPYESYVLSLLISAQCTAYNLYANAYTHYMYTHNTHNLHTHTHTHTHIQ